MRRAFLLVLMMAAGPSVGAELAGRIDMVADGKPLRPEEAAEAVVYFRPSAPPAAKPAPQPYLMSTQRKQFVPRVLPIVVGSQVRFPNQDPILHNAFSTAANNSFDVGLYGQGDGDTVTFAHPGYVRVYCNVHHSMVGHILVLDTPWFARPAADGSFRLTDLPATPGDLVVWHDRATPFRASVTPGSAPAQTVTLELNQKRIPQHMNKFGKPYGRSGEGNGY